MPAYYTLSDSAHACLVGQTWVILDTREDRYLCLAGRQSDWFDEIYEQGIPSSPDAVRFAARLCARGILTHSVQPRSMAACAQPVVRGQMTVHSPDGFRSPVRAADLLTLARGMVILGHLQDPGRRNLHRIMSSVQGWKRKATTRYPPQDENAIERSQAFHSLSPWFFTAHDACFFRSLLLIYFLARSGVGADWTFGVRLSPFRAHCWVSADGVLLNEDPDVAAGFQPILTI